MLADLDLQQLRNRWQAFYKSEAPRNMSRELLIQAIAFRMQEKALGGLARNLKDRLEDIGRHKKASRRNTSHRYKPGTRFIREWQGRRHEVMATENGLLLYNGRGFRSLSSIAREITGTRWSGPAFFGLPKTGDS